ncbi:MAG: hypothetical protein IPO91_15540 [Chloroflexi bacterium]|nr:hypothetical protein [Chloroflexota bacterium]
MSYRITQSGKHSLILETPVMNAAGMLGFGDNYRDLLKYEKLGAFVTNPITYAPRSPANGTRIVPLDAGVLVHTGLPNPGMNKVISGYRAVWEKLGAPIITHIVVTTPDEIRRCLQAVDREEIIDAVELGLHDETTPQEVERLIKVARESVEKPLLVVLPFNAAQDMAQAIIAAGGDALVACSAPRHGARQFRQTGRGAGVWSDDQAAQSALCGAVGAPFQHPDHRGGRHPFGAGCARLSGSGRSRRAGRRGGVVAAQAAGEHFARTGRHDRHPAD